jgi:hypothetical protein
MADYVNQSQHQISHLVHGEEIHPDGVDAPLLVSRMLHRLLLPGPRIVNPPLDQVAKECEAQLSSRVQPARPRQQSRNSMPVEFIQIVSRLCNSKPPRTLLAAVHALINLRLPLQLFRHPDLVVALRRHRGRPQPIADHLQALVSVVNVEGGTSGSRGSTTCSSNRADLETVEALARKFVVAAQTDNRVWVVPRPKALVQEHRGLRKRVADRVYPVKAVLIF